jgi:prepilin-type N-terminal cleavage/methylation domain-containing protein
VVVSRHAFTMIELIFAIVLIAIVVAAVPQMLQRNMDTQEGNLVQEDVFNAKKLALKIISYPWDPNSQDTTSSTAYSKVLDVGGLGFARVTVPTASGNVAIPFRVGHVRQPLHRRFHNSVTAPASPNIGAFGDSGYVPDDGSHTFRTTHNTTPKNMKMAIATSGNVKLYVYAANIGEYDYFKRQF